MKKIKKLFLAVALIFGLTSLLPSLVFIQNTASAGTAISYILVEGFQTEANVGSRYYLVDGKLMEQVVGGALTELPATIDISVKNPLGVELTVQTDAEGDYVEVNSRGTYTVTYTLSDVQNILKFTAVEGIYSFEFEENLEQIVPSVMNINYSEKVVLPMPAVLNEDGEEIDSPIIDIKVLKPGQSEPLSSADLVLNTEGYYEFSVNAVGVWTIEYLYKSADGRVLASTSKSITANSTYNNTYTLTYVYDDTLPTTAVTGVETELPSVTATNPAGNEVEVYYTITAKKVVYNTTTGVVETNVDVTNDVISGSTFTPNADGDYLITYIVKDFFGNTATSSTFPISGVTDSQAPEVKIVNAYNEDLSDLNTDYDASYDIPAKTAIKNFVLPAIWAEDNVDTTLAGLTLTRKIVKTSGDVIFESDLTPNKELVFNYDESSYTLNTATQEQATLAEGVTFGAGTYNVIYIATDSAGNESTSLSYRVVLESGFIDSEDPTIEWSDTEALPVNTRIGDTISFASPTTEDNVDSRIRTKVEYFFYNGIELTENDWTVLEAEDGIYSIEVESAQKLYIRATATDSHENTSSITKQIEIIDTNDTQALKLTDLNEGLNDYVQGNELTLKGFTITDDYIDFVSFDYYVEVTLADSSVVKLDAYNAQVSVSGNELTVSDAKLLASFAGDYNVYFIAKDLKNNYVIDNYTFNVGAYDEQTEIAFSKLPSTLNGGTLELGETLSLPQAEITAPAGATTSYNVRVINGPTGYSINRYEFAPTKVGTYTIEYYGTVTVGADTTNLSKTFTVEVEDTTAPVIGDIYVEPVVSLDYEFTFPQWTVTDLSEIDTENSKVVLSSTSFGTRTVYYGSTTTTAITLGYNEVYTLTFTAKDIYGNTSTLTKTIKVGDTDAPVIEVDEDDALLIPESMNVGDKLTIDLSKISVYDLVDTDLSIDDLAITVTRDGTEVENDYGDSTTNYRYTLDTAGTYTVKLVITDAAGNSSETITRTITVTEATNDGVETTEVIGIVLIVVSALILAGAIVYFIISKRKADKYKG